MSAKGERAAAKAIGKRRYLTGRACAAGHVAERNTATGSCCECNRVRAAKRARIDRAHFARVGRARHHKNPGARYGLTSGQYQDLVAKHNNRCAICGAGPAEGRRHSVDHDHATGVIRGLLCDACNRGLGFFKDDGRLLRCAANYVGRTA